MGNCQLLPKVLETQHKHPVEAEIVARLKAGDEKALDLAYVKYSPALYGVLHKILRNEENAGDVLQDTFVKVWLNIARYDASKGTFFTWMLNIARNGAIDLLRSKSHKNAVKGILLDDALPAVNRQVNISQAVESIGLREKVGSLHPDLRLMIEMQYFLGYTQSEVAEELQMPLGTVKTRTRSALAELRKWMGDTPSKP
jgi:RNA polymerase sigma-70 factor, ECF subfamily